MKATFQPHLRPIVAAYHMARRRVVVPLMVSRNVIYPALQAAQALDLFCPLAAHAMRRGGR